MEKKFKIGDKIRITKSNSHYFKEGDVGVLTQESFPSTEYGYWAKFPAHPHSCCLGTNVGGNLFELADEPVKKGPLTITYAGVSITLDPKIAGTKALAEAALNIAFD